MLYMVKNTFHDTRLERDFCFNWKEFLFLQSAYIENTKCYVTINSISVTTGTFQYACNTIPTYLK